jgi:hypothetical protein
MDQPTQKHGPGYWFIANTVKAIRHCAKNHWKTTAITMAVVGWCMFVFRAYWQPYIVFARAHSPECLYAAILLAAMWHSSATHRWNRLLFLLGIAVVSIFLHTKMEVPPLRYLTYYLRYRNLNPEVLADLPITDHERIQPLNSIRVLASEAMKEVEKVSMPDFVRIGSSNGGEYRWTMAIEPAYPIPQFLGNIKELLNVSGTATSPNFSGENRMPVSFRVGEGLSWGKNTSIAVIRSFGLWRFLSYSPRDVKFLKDDHGEWVEVVSLIKWRGIIFVWPEFGGVQVIRQKPDTIGGIIKSWFVGDGEWIPAKEVVKYSYLSRQNTMPYEVSRYIATSLRFQNGFLAPMPWYHKGDVRIPDLPGDQNDQPFCTYFKFLESSGKVREEKLTHYFALEPYHDTKQGLNTSVFVPADGIGRVKVYQHYKVNEALTGVSAIAAKVMESRKEYDWEQSQPVEHRPWIKEISGKRRFFWLTTVVTYKDKKHVGDQAFIAGSTPATTLTDALYKNVVWTDPHQPNKWVDEVHSKLAVVWKSN